MNSLHSNLMQSEVDYWRNFYYEEKDKYREAKEALKIHCGLQDHKISGLFGNIGVHRCLWISWESRGKTWTRQISWSKDVHDSNFMKYDWIYQRLVEWHEAKMLVKEWMNKN